MEEMTLTNTEAAKEIVRTNKKLAHRQGHSTTKFKTEFLMARTVKATLKKKFQWRPIFAE